MQTVTMESKYLKYDQIVAITDAVTIAQQLSASQLRRNMQLSDSPGKKIAPELLQSVQHWVKMSRTQLTMKQLDGFDINSSYGSLQKFLRHSSKHNWFSTCAHSATNRRNGTRSGGQVLAVDTVYATACMVELITTWGWRLTARHQVAMPPFLKAFIFPRRFGPFYQATWQGALAALDWMRTSQRLHMRTHLKENLWDQL